MLDPMKWHFNDKEKKAYIYDGSEQDYVFFESYSEMGISPSESEQDKVNRADECLDSDYDQAN